MGRNLAHIFTSVAIKRLIFNPPLKKGGRGDFIISSWKSP